MATDRRQLALLGVLLAVLLLVGYRAWMATPAQSATPSEGRGAAPGVAHGEPTALAAPDVHLHTLGEDRPKPEPGERDLFRFRPQAQPPAPPSRGVPPPLAAPPPIVPAGPSPPPPIQLKFIGVIRGADRSKIAVLSDGRTPVPFHGREGDIIEGRYRILKIGEESIELAYADGRGRQTIRLSGS